MSGSTLVEFPGGHGVHLNEGDAAVAPLLLGLIDREEGLEQEVDDTLGNRMRVNSQAGQQVVHAAHIPELDIGRRRRLMRKIGIFGLVRTPIRFLISKKNMHAHQ